MRLIDADTMNFDGLTLNKSQMKAVLDFIDIQPTAYDVDKVVEQLDKEAKVLYSLRSFDPVSAWETKDILPIVKGGGMGE